MYSSDEPFQRLQEGYFGVYFPSCEATKEINTKITLEWAQKRLVTRVHTLFYFLHDKTNPWMTPQLIAEDVTITRQLWCNHANNDI